MEPFAFRVTAEQRAEIQAKAAAMGLTPNQYARACTLVGLAPALRVTPNENVHRNRTAPAHGELTVEYDEVGR